MLGLAALILVSMPSRAADAPQARRCRDGKAPVFTGQPFSPLTCERTEEAAPAVELSSTSLPATKGAPVTLDAIQGRWDGQTVYGGQRYRVALSVGKGKSYDVRFEDVDVIMQTRHAFAAELKGGGFFGPKGRYDAVVALEELPEPHEATVFVGAPYAPDKEGFDRELVVVYRGRSDAHRVRFRLEGDVLRYRYDYTFAKPKPGTMSASGELRRAKTP